VKIKQGISVVAMVTALGSKDLSMAYGETLTTMLNHAQGFDTIRSLMNDLRGMTDSNAPLLRMINVVKSSIDALRQDYREKIPEELANQFSRDLTKQEWSHLHQGLGQADMLALGLNDAQALMKDPTSVGSMIQREEEALKNLAGKYTPRYLSKMKDLAHYMVTREVRSENLLRNSVAIAKLLGENQKDSITIQRLYSDDLVKAISRLTSLYASFPNRVRLL
jgi:hypothetical protein